MASPSLNAVISTLKACVISNPDGVDEDRLNNEFRQLMGSNIPWRDLGFKSLQDLIKGSSCLKVVTRGGRRLVVAETNSVEHITAMIKTQKKPSARKRPSRSGFFQRRVLSHKPPSGGGFRGGGNYRNGPPPRRQSFRRVDFVETNNNVPYRPPANKEVHHYSNCRPAGDSSSGSSSPTLSPLSPEPKQSFKQSQSKQRNKPSSNKDSQINHKEQYSQPANPKSPPPGGKGPAKKNGKITFAEPEIISIPTQNSVYKSFKPPQSPILKAPSPQSTILKAPSPQSTILKAPSPQSTILKAPSPQNTILKLPTPQSPLLKTPTPQSPLLKTPTPQSLVLKPGPYAPIVNSSLFTSPIPLSNVLQAPEPNIYFSPINLQTAFVPANLVPPKPMKPGSYYRGGRRKSIKRSKLMSIKDNSTPSEDSLTAKFINLVKAQEWPEPEYRLLPRIGPNKVEVYGCTLRGSYTFDNNETLSVYDYSTIPDEFSNKNDSKEAVSKKAFEDMSNKIKEASNYIPVTSNPNIIIERIYNMVTAFSNGLWAYKIESDYKEKFGERLPSKWVDVISDTDILTSEKLADFSHVIRVAKTIYDEDNDDIKMPLGKMEYPETETWDVFITKIVSSTEVWFRFVGPNYSDWLDEVTKQMCEHYEDWSMYICPSPVVGDVYVYSSMYGASRVKVISLDTPNMATVMHIDHGDIEEIPRDHLCILDFNFRKLPPQAICCRLYDLEEYSDNKLCTALLLDKLEGMVLVAEIIQTEPLVLVMHDTSSDEPVNVNQDIVNSLTIDLTIPPSLSKDIAVQEGVVTSIWRTGEIYLQLPNEGLTHLTESLDSIQEIQPEFYISLPEDVLPDIVYLVDVNGSWLRACILPPARAINNMVELLLIDTGDILTSLYTNLVPLNLISVVLSVIPRQAVRVRLSKVDMYEDTVVKLQSLMSPPCNAIVKVVELGHVPEVEVYIRDSKGLISVNHTLFLEENLSKNVKRLSLNNSSSDFTTLKPATTPECGEFMDVYVVSVSNPSNFIVIPRKYIVQLTRLQNALQEYYNSADPTYHKLRNFSIGQVCAVHHTDGQWYRGLIEKIIDRSMSQLMIRFCDFGNFSMISTDRLLALDSNFLDLPALGFNASIADIRPLSGDWEFVDCIRSQRLMLEKNLVTVIKSKEEDQGKIFLKVQIFDTTDDEDIDIGQILIDEFRATSIDV